jgi:hypothetical protein
MGRCKGLPFVPPGKIILSLGKPDLLLEILLDGGVPINGGNLLVKMKFDKSKVWIY